MQAREDPPPASPPDLYDVWKKVWRKEGEPPVEVRSFLECLQHASRGGISEYHLVSVRQPTCSATHNRFIRIPRSGNPRVPSPYWNQLGFSVDENETNTDVRLSVSHVTAVNSFGINDRRFRLEALRRALFGETPRQLASLLGKISTSKPFYPRPMLSLRQEPLYSYTG